MDKHTTRMGEERIPKLIIRMAVPAIISMMVQALYNIVDSIFVASISEKALTALSLAFPIQIVMIALFVGLGMGLNSVISRRLGEKRMDRSGKLCRARLPSCFHNLGNHSHHSHLFAEMVLWLFYQRPCYH